MGEGGREKSTGIIAEREAPGATHVADVAPSAVKRSSARRGCGSRSDPTNLHTVRSAAVRTAMSRARGENFGDSDTYERLIALESRRGLVRGDSLGVRRFIKRAIVFATRSIHVVRITPC